MRWREYRIRLGARGGGLPLDPHEDAQPLDGRARLTDDVFANDREGSVWAHAVVVLERKELLGLTRRCGLVRLVGSQRVISIFANLNPTEVNRDDLAYGRLLAGVGEACEDPSGFNRHNAYAFFVRIHPRPSAILGCDGLTPDGYWLRQLTQNRFRGKLFRLIFTGHVKTNKNNFSGLIRRDTRYGELVLLQYGGIQLYRGYGRLLNGCAPKTLALSAVVEL